MKKNSEIFTYGLAISYNKYKSGKTINSQVISGSFLFFGFDAFANFDSVFVCENGVGYVKF